MLLELIYLYSSVINSFTQYPLYEVGTMYVICTGIIVGIRILKELGD